MKTFLVGVYSAVLVAAFGLFVFSGSWKTAVNEVAKTSTHDGEIRELAKTQQEIATAPKGSILWMKDGSFLVVVEAGNVSTVNFIKVRGGFEGLLKTEVSWLAKETQRLYKPNDCPDYNYAATRLALQMAELQAPTKK